MNKKTLTAIIIGVAILSVMTTKAIDRAGSMEKYVINIIHALRGEVKAVVE